MIAPGIICVLLGQLLVLISRAIPAVSFQQPLLQPNLQQQQQQQQHRFSVLPTTITITSSTAKATTGFRLLASSSDGNNRNSSNNSINNAPPQQQQQQPYVPMREDQPLGKQKKALIPRIGDVVRYYDLDGGDREGEVLVGKISYVFGSRAYGGFSVELNELEDVGDGYFAEYSSALRSRKGRKTERRLEEVSPIAASFVGVEQAYKVPIDASTNLPKPRQETYDIDEYEGPAFYANIDGDVVERDAENYAALKSKLFRNVLLTGLVGTVLANATSGAELAAIYFAGSVASLLYLFLLSVKTDTVAVNSEDNTKNLAGTPIANLRFGAPVLVLLGVSLWNTQKMSSGLGGGGIDGDDGFTMQIFDTVTREQFGAAILGFLTYRLPLFVGQIRDAFRALEAEDAEAAAALAGPGGSGVRLPGSAGVAAELLSRRGRGTTAATTTTGIGENGVVASDRLTILLVSGPQATGRHELVRRLLESSNNNGDGDGDNNNDGDGDGRLSNLVPPNRVLRIDDGMTFERLERRNEFLEVSGDGSSGLTKEGILDAAAGLVEGKEVPNKNVVVVDACVELARKLTTTALGANTRLICVWVGLNSVGDFEARLEESIADGSLRVPEDETKESFVRAKIKDIINEIDFGLGAGIFEFTILNDAADPDKSLRELREAASYAFK